MTITVYIVGLSRDIGPITTLEDHGIAVVAPAARYCSRYWIGLERADRRFASPAEWRAVEAELTEDRPAGPFPPESAVARLVLGGDVPARVAVFLRYETVRISTPAETVAVLDGLLRIGTRA